MSVSTMTTCRIEDAAKARQRRSRIAQGLNVPTRVRLAFRSLRPCWTSFFTILEILGVPLGL